MCKKKFKMFFKPLFAILLIFCGVVISSIAYMDNTLPDDYSVFDGTALEIKTKLPVTAVYSGDKSSNANISKNPKLSNYDVQLKALGIFPIKQASVSVVTENDVLVLGEPFGIKIYTDGVMIVGIDSVQTEKGKITPATNAGLKEGDLIISINSQKVYSNEDVAAIIESSKGKALRFLIKRNDKQQEVKVTPALCFESGKYKTGIWVRDSSAGIGTLTFYSPSKGVVCGLGHGVCDVDTGELLTLNAGELVDAEIIGVNKGASGNPGELMGKFKESTIGKLLMNNETGVYAACEIDYEANKLCKLALKQEVKTGKAQIYTTIDGEKPQFYECEIDKIAHNNSITKNMVIHVTDERLINSTGGIVQGMSGSPIYQNGKLVGAVTHVFLDDPTGGYAIFAENMLETAQSVAEDQQLKDAS